MRPPRRAAGGPESQVAPGLLADEERSAPPAASETVLSTWNDYCAAIAAVQAAETVLSEAIGARARAYLAWIDACERAAQ